MLMIQVFSYNPNQKTIYIESPTRNDPQLMYINRNGRDLIYQNLNWTIDCNIMDMKNIVLYLNGLRPKDYSNIYEDYVKYDYEYNCNKQLLELNISSYNKMLVGFDLKIKR